MIPNAPQQLGDFRIEGKLGQGAMGTVYRAHQTSLHRIVALKVLPPHAALDPEFIARFRQEARAAAALNHPHIVQIYAAGESEGTHFFAMEYVDGETLGTRVARKGRLDPREAMATAVYVARALDYAWKRVQIIHRDIKPDNIFLSREGEVKLGDLGLAKALDAQAMGMTQTGIAMGTPYYVSPEQARGDRGIDFRADIYSLGCTLFHVLTGVTPYQGDSAMGVMIQHLTQPPPKIEKVWPGCPLPIVGLIERMLRKDVGARHQSYQELIEELLWVAEKLEEPGALSEPARSMLVPTPASVKGTAAPVTASAALPPVEGGSRKRLAVAAGAVVLLVIGALVLAPWKKPAVETAVPAVGFAGPAETVSRPEKTKEPPAKAEPAKIPPAPEVRPTEKPEPIAKVDELPAKTELVKMPEVENPAIPSPVAAADSTAANTVDAPVSFTPGAWIELFNGLDVSRWRGAKRDSFPVDAWTIEGGALRDVSGPNAQNLVTLETFRDFELEFEWRVSPGGNSGIFYGPREFQLVDDVGHPNGKVPNTSAGALCYVFAPNAQKRLKPAGEYNPAGEFNAGRLIVKGNHVEHWINGAKVLEYELGSAALKSLAGQSQYIDVAGFADAGDTPIQLQRQWGKVWFRNVRIRRLTLSPVVTPPPVAPQTEGKFVSLLDGLLTGWRGGDTFDHRKLLAMSPTARASQVATWTSAMFAGNPKTGKPHWYMQNGELVNDGFGGAATEKDYGNFELRLEYKTGPRADAGVYLRGVPQVQIWNSPDKGSGGLYNNSVGAPGGNPLVRADKPFGEWNQLRIIMVGSLVSVWLNEKKVVDNAVLENYFDRTQPVPARGPIQLQNLGGEIRWRNILIREIGAADAPEAIGGIATAAAQADAVRKYPQLGRTGSAFNLEFVRRFKSYQAQKPDFFKNTAWPLKLAEEVAAMPSKPRKILFFSKSSGFEHSVISYKNGTPSFAEKVLSELGAKNGWEFKFSKDGSLFTAEYLEQFDALCFFTSGDLCTPGTDGQPPLTRAGKQALLDAVTGGKGFIGIHSATDTFHTNSESNKNTDRYKNFGEAADPYVKMIGGEFLGHGPQQIARMRGGDPKFPGIAKYADGFALNEEWYSLKDFRPDLHVLLLQETANMNGSEYQRPAYPATWVRQHGRGRVFYTSMGHREDVWTNPIFQEILTGGIAWALGDAAAVSTPNLNQVAPKSSLNPPFPTTGR